SPPTATIPPSSRVTTARSPCPTRTWPGRAVTTCSWRKCPCAEPRGAPIETKGARATDRSGPAPFVTRDGPNIVAAMRRSVDSAELEPTLPPAVSLLHGNRQRETVPCFAVPPVRARSRDKGTRVARPSLLPQCHLLGHTVGQPNSDGNVVIFNSNMNASGQYDLFVAEMPLR